MKWEMIKDIFIVVVLMGIVISGIMWSVNVAEKKNIAENEAVYQIGITDGVNGVTNYIISSINEKGFFILNLPTIINNETNSTVQYKLGIITE